MGGGSSDTGLAVADSAADPAAGATSDATATVATDGAAAVAVVAGPSVVADR